MEPPDATSAVSRSTFGTWGTRLPTWILTARLSGKRSTPPWPSWAAELRTTAGRCGGGGEPRRKPSGLSCYGSSSSSGAVTWIRTHGWASTTATRCSTWFLQLPLCFQASRYLDLWSECQPARRANPEASANATLVTRTGVSIRSSSWPGLWSLSSRECKAWCKSPRWEWG